MINRNGEKPFIKEKLTTGLYLILQETPAKGFGLLSAFLVSVPYLKNGSYVYDVTAVAKPELEREPETEPTQPVTVPSGGKLPQTGQLNWPVPVMTAVGVGLLVVGWSLRGRKESGQAKN